MHTRFSPCLTGHAGASSAPGPGAYANHQAPCISPLAEAQPNAVAADAMATFAQRYRHACARVADDKRRFFDFFLAICQGISVRDAAYVYNVSTGCAQTYRHRLLQEGPDALFTFFATERHKAWQPGLQPPAMRPAHTRASLGPTPIGQVDALHVPAPTPAILAPTPASPPDTVASNALWPVIDEPPLSDTGGPTPAQSDYFLRYTRAHFDQIPHANKRRFTAFMMVCEGRSQSYVGTEMGIHPESLARDADLLACAGPRALFNHLLHIHLAPASRMPPHCDAPDGVLAFTESAACVHSLGAEPPLADDLVPTQAQRAYYVRYADAHIDQLPAPTQPRAKILALVCQGVSQPQAAQQTRIPESSASTYLRILARRGPKAAFAHFLNPKVIGCAKRQKPWQRRPGRSAQDRAFGAIFRRVQKSEKAAKAACRRATYQAKFMRP